MERVHSGLCFLSDGRDQGVLTDAQFEGRGLYSVCAIRPKCSMRDLKIEKAVHPPSLHLRLHLPITLENTCFQNLPRIPPMQ